MSGLYAAMPLWVLLTSVATAVVIFILGEEQRWARTFVNLAGAVVKLVLVGVMLHGVGIGDEFRVAWEVLPGIELILIGDALTLLFITLSAILWLVTTVYAIGYLEGSPHRARFFGFFSLCVAATMGIASAGNLFTFFIFYEALTLATYPLVVHRGTEQAMAAGRTYLRYTLGAGAALLPGIVALELLVGNAGFVHGGVPGVAALAAQSPGTAIALFWLLIAGVGVKTALLPLHGWLPMAMVAPAPVSALLHAVAVVKAGAFGVVRVVHDVFGHEVVVELGVALPLALLAAATILYGSVLALNQSDIKRRMAYSTVSQVSYIVLGIAVGGPVALVGGLVHLVHQGLMKITLFFCAGSFAEILDIKRVDQLDGVGRQMPWTSAAFTLGALGMIGVPPMAGFISKWYLGIGGWEGGQPWVVAVLAVSTVLNAAYFLPLLRRIWLQRAPAGWPHERVHRRGLEGGLWLLLPPVFTALAALFAGLLAAAPLSPLSWAQLIVAREYTP